LGRDTTGSTFIGGSQPEKTAACAMDSRSGDPSGLPIKIDGALVGGIGVGGAISD
jgi:uncharacterized protein GlcG (DUF336 family)